jgi:uncharacterized membrane protein (DUF485 family)
MAPDPCSPPDTQRIRDSAAFQQLCARRNRLSLLLTLAMLVIYFGFILLVAFAPEFLGTRIGTSHVTLGIPLGLAVILSAIALTGVYVWRANEFDRLSREALGESPQ